MTAVCKKELKSFLTNMTGAVAVAAMLLVAGLMFRYYNLFNGVLTFHYTVSNSTLIFFIVIPVLAMRSFSEERKLKTDQLLLTAPVKIRDIVLGKYLAMVTVFAVPVAVMCLCPLFMRHFGEETMLWDYVSIFAFFLMGCAYLSVGMFLSCCTESAVISAILTIVFVVSTQMLSSLFTMISTSPLSALLFLVVIAVLMGLLLYVVTKHFLISLLLTAAAAAALIAGYVFSPEWFGGRTESILRILDFSTHFSEFAGGVCSLGNIVFFLSYIAAGIILTVRSVEIRRGDASGGFYAAAGTAVAVGIIFLVNLIVKTVPAAFTTADVTDMKLYSIGTTSRELLDSLDEDVTLHVLLQNGQEDEAVLKLLDAYAAYSGKVHVNRVDTVANPTFVKQYSEETVPLNSVIAECGEKTAIASGSSFYLYDEYGYYTGSASAWDAEGQITSAIAGVSSENSGHIYYTSGHDELSISGEMADAFAKAGIETSPVKLLGEEIPEDCTALLIFAPAQDFSEDEVKKVRHYLENGGRLLLITMSEAVTGSATPQLDRIMETYGISRKGGLAMEQNAGSYLQAPYLLLPQTGNSEVSAALSNQNIVCALPEALEVGDTDEAPYTVSTVLATSAEAYVKPEVLASVEKESGDESGQFVLAAAVEETYSADSMGEPDVPLEEEAEDSAGEEDADESGGKKAARILYYTTPCLFSSDALSTLVQQAVSLPEGNLSLFARSIAYLTDQEAAVSVPPKTLAVPQAVIDSGTQMIVGNIVMFALPAIVLAVGFGIWWRRRRR